jgi:hypothetical protein
VTLALTRSVRSDHAVASTRCFLYTGFNLRQNWCVTYADWAFGTLLTWDDRSCGASPGGLATSPTPWTAALFRDEEDGLTAKAGGHSPQSVRAGRDLHAFVPLRDSAFVQVADIVNGVGDDSAVVAVGPVV